MPVETDAIGVATMRKRTDPISECGRFWCDRCNVEAFPTRARWLSKNLIIAEFAGCEHTTLWRILDTNEPFNYSRCQARTKKGTRCKNAPVNGFYCHLHLAYEDTSSQPYNGSQKRLGTSG